VTVARAPRAPRRAPSELTFIPDRDLIESFAADEPDWLAADRRAALALFEELPTETNQLYTPYIDPRSADLADVTLLDRAETLFDEPHFHGRTTDAAARASISVKGLAYRQMSEQAQAAGVIVEPLDEVVRNRPELARRLLGDVSSLPTDDKLAQMTRAGWNQGLVVHIPAGVQLTDPIVLAWGIGAPGSALLSRTIVDVGAGARASIIEDVNAVGRNRPVDRQDLFTATLEIRVGAGAELAVASIQDLSPLTVAFQHRYASIGEAASLHWALAQLGGRIVRSRVDNVLAGDRSSVEQVEIVFGADDQLFDLTSYTRHVGRDTTGNLLSKGVLMDASRSYMKGMITIDKTAIGTDSFLGEFGMNLSKKARSVAIPSLEIDQPDCRRAAHSSSVGPIDETQLFYLESRGIPPDEARKFIVLGFLEPVVARVPLEAERDRLRELLEEKWASGTEGAAAA
jgi:Fe-S cluster assembly scaffold protein SufB